MNNELQNTLNSILSAIKENSKDLPPSLPIEEPKPIYTHLLEGLGLITKEVLGGEPVLNVHLLKSCEYDGCIPSSSGIHTVNIREHHEDLKPILYQDEFGNWQPALDENGEPTFKKIYHEYMVAYPCKYCGLINKRLLSLKRSGIGADAYRKHFNNYQWESEQLESRVNDFMQGEIRGGLIWGKSGNGKTHLLCAVTRELVWRGYKVRYVSHQHLLESIKRSFDGDTDPRVKWLDGVDVVIFDELGFCPKTEWAKQTTNELIHAIHATDARVLFASNLSPKELKSSLLDSRSASRMGELVGEFVYNMKSYDRRGSF